ncbi:MAG: hypothetical protein QXY99_02105 [Thermoproteota archaeon]
MNSEKEKLIEEKGPAMMNNFQPRRHGSINTALEILRLMISTNSNSFEQAGINITSEDLSDAEKFYNKVKPFMHLVYRLALDIEQHVLKGLDMDWNPKVREEITNDNVPPERPYASETPADVLLEQPEQSPQSAPVQTDGDRQKKFSPTPAQQKLIEKLSKELGYPEVIMPETKEEARDLIDRLLEQRRNLAKELAQPRSEEGAPPTQAQQKYIEGLLKELGRNDITMPKTKKEAQELISELVKERKEMMKAKRSEQSEMHVSISEVQVTQSAKSLEDIERTGVPTAEQAIEIADSISRS